MYKRSDGSQAREVPVRVAFFRRVNFAVDLSMPEGLHYLGGDLEARFSAGYLGGGRLTQGRWNYWWARQPIAYRPPDPEENYRGFRFGSYPDFGYYDYYDDYYEELSSAEGQLVGDGTVLAVQALSDGHPGRVYEYTLSATIEDIDRQAVSRRASATVFSSSLLLGASISGEDGQSLYFVGEQQPFTLQVCLLRPDGSPYDPDVRDTVPIQGRLLRENWKMVRERSIGGTGGHALGPGGDRGAELCVRRRRAGRIPRAGCSGSRSWPPPGSGPTSSNCRARTRRAGRPLTRLDFYSTGSGNVLWQRYDEQTHRSGGRPPGLRPGGTRKTADQESAGSGQLSADGGDGRGSWRSGSWSWTGSTDTVEIPISEQHVPVVYVTLSSATGPGVRPPGDSGSTGPGQAAGCFGMLALSVDSDSRRIELGDREPARPATVPGAEAEVTVRASRNGQPLEGAEIVLVAADRGVLDLIDYHLPDPLWPCSTTGTTTGTAWLISTAGTCSWTRCCGKLGICPAATRRGRRRMRARRQVRRDFRATAVFEPGLVHRGATDWRRCASACRTS